MLKYIYRRLDVYNVEINGKSIRKALGAMLLGIPNNKKQPNSETSSTFLQYGEPYNKGLLS